jgi:plastocyanin
VPIFLIRQGGGAGVLIGPPLIGDNWHAGYEIYVCDTRQPPIPPWQGGVRTDGDGVIHIHPDFVDEQGVGARLVRWFEYGGEGLGTGGQLSKDTLHIPGQDREYRNGDLCPDGQPGVVQVFVNGERRESFDRYIPQDGDSVRILFGPEGELPPGVVASPTPEAGIRTIRIEAGDQGQPELDSFFDPSILTIQAGEKVRVEVQNTGSISHNLRIAGIDGQYQTDDDFVSEPMIITPGEAGTLDVQIDTPGTYAIRCDSYPQVHFGSLTVEATP